MKQRIVILGSTGSIGRNALEVLRTLRDEFDVVGLAAGSRWSELADQVREWRPTHVAIGHEEFESPLRQAVNGCATVFSGPQGLVELVEQSGCDVVLSAIVGISGLPATIRAVELGKRVAIANKETLVAAGSWITQLARRSGSTLIPVDSEHSAIFQALHLGLHDELHRVYLTSSGGPLRTWPIEKICTASLEDVLNHPVWDMGPKITIDSATMMNKALEIVEAHWLFGIPPDRIEVLIHPEAVVHSLVEFCDGCLIAQLGSPDMRIPIQYALTYPRRMARSGASLDLRKVQSFHFEAPDLRRFPAIELGFEVLRRGGVAGAVLNAANEAAVEAYRSGRIQFGEIYDRAASALSECPRVEVPTLDDLVEADRWARSEVTACLKC